MDHYFSWGRYPRRTAQAVLVPHWRDQILSLTARHTAYLPRGLGRSYGDVCLISEGALLVTTHLQRCLNFDKDTGVLRVEAGASLGDILPLLIEHGWFLPVSPGTRFVTFGGALANDIHGKNHHQEGTFGRHVRAFELVRSTGEVFVCTPEVETDLFRATIGGLGVTGVITWVEVQLMLVASAFMDVTYTPFVGIQEFLRLSDRSTAPYTVAWLDAASSVCRGMFMEGKHAQNEERPRHLSVKTREWLQVPIDAPTGLLGPWSMKLFNTLYYHLQTWLPATRRVDLLSFFYPLDSVRDWNRLYGKQGFLQYQFVVPTDQAEHVVNGVLARLRAAGHLSFLTVLKKFGDLASPGVLSFPLPGVTLALDMLCTPGLFGVLDELDQMVLAAGGRLYPAKDARMSPEMFQASYPQWREVERMRDPAIQSDFWKRVTHVLSKEL